TDGVAAGTRGADAAGTQDVVAHEERLRATGQSERRETGRARLRKHVVTETETVEVPVRREELHIQRESIDPDSPEARAGAQDAFTGDGEETVVTTYEERPVVSTETVATERVSLNKEATESTERVSGEVRKEEIEVDEDGRPRR
ncbi:YsnF/AvaK domain-containing protein, partial [Rothia kristinae]